MTHHDLRDGHVLEREPGGQRIDLHVPEPYLDLPIFARTSDIACTEGFVSATDLLQKAKVFDDGVLAAAELAAMNGAGGMRGKMAWLPELRSALGDSAAGVLLHGAARLLDADYCAPEAVASEAGELVERFLRDPLRSKPISFYTWSEKLRALFRHDRFLQTPLDETSVGEIARVLSAHPQLRADYERQLRFHERLTNPLTESALRDAVEGEPACAGALLPPSRAHETELIKRLHGDSPIPPGFDLMREICRGVRSGTLDLDPTEESGFYDHVLFSLEPLLKQSGVAERKRVQWSSDYEQRLLELFQIAYACARESQIKQVEIPRCGSALGAPPPRPKIYVYPELTLEPLPSHYRRRADAYRFLEGVLEDFFGSQGLATMRRVQVGGLADLSLAEELRWITDLFDGAADRSLRDLGELCETPRPQEEVFQAWRPASDPDLAADHRMMVPVFFDEQRQLTKVWAFLGWERSSLLASYDVLPQVTIRDRRGRDVTEEYDIVLGSQSMVVPRPLFAEVYTDRIMDRDEFRHACDRHKTLESWLSEFGA